MTHTWFRNPLALGTFWVWCLWQGVYPPPQFFFLAVHNTPFFDHGQQNTSCPVADVTIAEQCFGDSFVLNLKNPMYCKVTNFRPVPIFVLLTWNWFVRTNFRTFEGLKTKLHWNLMASRPKIKFRPVLNFALFQKYEIKYRTEICGFTVYFLNLWSHG